MKSHALPLTSEQDRKSSQKELSNPEYFVDGAGQFVRKQHLVISNASSGKNVICVSIFRADLVICGGVDGYLNGFHCKNGEPTLKVPMQSPVLSIDCTSNAIACSMMDGSLGVLTNIPVFQLLITSSV